MSRSAARRRELYAKDPAKVLAVNKAWRLANPEKVKQSTRRYYAKNSTKLISQWAQYRSDNPEKVRAGVARYAKKNPGKVKESRRVSYLKNSEARKVSSRKYRIDNRDAVKSRELRRRYGIGLEELNSILESQGGICAICCKPIPDRPAVDHCHETGRIRGILHIGCNSGIGLLGDDPEILQRAIHYLNGDLL